MDIAEFLTARYDEEQQLAKRAMGQYADGSPWGPHWTYDREHFRVLIDGQLAAAVEETSDVDGEHIAYHDPAHVLADIAAKRAVLAYLQRVTEVMLDANLWTLADPRTTAMRQLAAPYADHPDFRPEWRIDG